MRGGVYDANIQHGCQGPDDEPDFAYECDTSDPGRAAAVVWAASVLFARVSGMNAENAIRTSRGEALAYNDDCYLAAVADAKEGMRTR